MRACSRRSQLRPIPKFREPQSPTGATIMRGLKRLSFALLLGLCAATVSQAQQKTIFLSTTGARTWTVPFDWNSAANTIEAIGGGGNNVTSGVFGGGGGGAYAKSNNVSLTPGASVYYQVGGSNTDTWFNSVAN